MNFSLLVDSGLIAGIIFIIQTIKKILANKGIFINNDIWTIIVLLIGIPCGLLITDFINFNWQIMIRNMFTYSGIAVLFYQTAKFSYEKGSIYLEKKRGE